MESPFAEKFNYNMLDDEFLAGLRETSGREKDNLPILRPNSAALYKVLLGAVRPSKILEAGTCQGYSSIFAAKALLSAGCSDFRIDTIELDGNNCERARQNIKAAGLENKIHLIEGDCVEVFSCLSGVYDMIFIDSSKGHYIDMYGDIVRLLRTGGMLICDDVTYYGKIEETPENSPHKHRTIVGRLRAFLDKVKTGGDFVSCIDMMDDGLLLAVKL